MTTATKQRRRMRILIAIQGLTALIAVGALVWTLIAQDEARTTERNDAIHARYQTCDLLRKLVLVSGSHSKSHQEAAQAFIMSTQLDNCAAYARNLTGKNVLKPARR